MTLQLAMQDHDRDIFEAKPPFLVLYANKQWKVAAEVKPHPRGVALIEPFSEGNQDAAVIIPGTPWHVGDNVWELDYATQIMTLDHPNYHHHPAWQLWLHWLKHQSEQPDLTTH